MLTPLTHIVQMAGELCTDVYDSHPSVTMKYKHVDVIRLDPQDTGQHAMLLYHRNVICVVFRGTSSQWDVRLDLTMSAVAFFTINGTPAGKMHGGFVERFNLLKWILLHPLRRMVRNHPNAEILLTGHSLGGALAIMCAVWVHELFPDKLRICAFGCPRTGDRAFHDFCAQYHVLNSRCILVQAVGDPITYLPYHFGVWYHPLCRVILIQRSGQQIMTMTEPTKLCSKSLHTEFWSLIMSLKTENHRMEYYRRAIRYDLPTTLTPTTEDNVVFSTPYVNKYLQDVNSEKS